MRDDIYRGAAAPECLAAYAVQVILGIVIVLRVGVSNV